MTLRNEGSLALASAALLVVVGALVAWYAWPRATLLTTQAEIRTSSSTPQEIGATTTQAQAPAQTQQSPVVSIDGQTISVTLALTEADQEQGLGGRTGLGDHEGMLFVFPSDAEHWFWMKDMEFSIDMLWMADDGTVIYIQPNVTPATYPQAFGPGAPSRYVLEVPANFAVRNGIGVGDRAILPQ